MFPKDFHYFLFYQIVVLHQICYCLPGIYCSNLDPLLQYVRDLQNIFLPELVNSVHQIFSEHYTTRNCCSVPSDIFRASYYQKLLLRSIRYFQNILLPEIVIPFHQISSKHLTTRKCYSVPLDIFRTSYYQKLLLRSIRHLQNILLPEILLHIIRYCCIKVCYFIS